jgi:hypothetical protein
MPTNNNPYGGPSYSFYKRGQTDEGVPTYDFFKGDADEAPSLTLPQGGYADQFITKIPERNEPDMRLAQNGAGGDAGTDKPVGGAAGGAAGTPQPDGGAGGKNGTGGEPPKPLGGDTTPPKPPGTSPIPGFGGSFGGDGGPIPTAEQIRKEAQGSSSESGTRGVLSPNDETALKDAWKWRDEGLREQQRADLARKVYEDNAREWQFSKLWKEREFDKKDVDLERDRAARVDEIEKELEQERLKSKNPNDFWDSRDTKSSIALGIGMALGAFATRPGEENQGARILNDAMSRHMRNREETVRKLYEKRGRTRENYADMQARLEAERRQALKQIDYQVQDQIARSLNPLDRAQFNKMVAQSRQGGAPPSRAGAASGGTPFGGSGSPGGAPANTAPGSSTDAARDLLGKAGAGIAKGAAAAKDTVSKYGNKAIDRLLDSDLSVLDPPPPGTPDKYGLLSPEGRLKQAEQDDRAALEYQRDYVMQRQRRGDAPPGPGELPEPSEKVTRRVYEIGKAQQAALDAMNKPARPPAPPPTLQNKRDAVLIDQLGAARAATGGLPPGTPPTRNATPNIPQVAQPVDAGMMQSRPEAPGQLTRSTPAPFVDARKEALQDLRRFNQEGIDYREGRRKEPPKPMKEEYIKELFSGQKPEAPAKGRKPPTEQNKRDKVLIDKELEAQRKKDAATFKEVLQKRKDIAVKLRRRDIAPKERATMETLDKQLGDLQKLMEKPATMEPGKEPSKADSVLNEWRKQAR